jgi:hypothetical protein
MTKLSRRTVVWLSATHAFVLLLGIAAGFAYDIRQRDRLATLLAHLGRMPRVEAADVAYRFGTAEHARALLSALPDDGDAMNTYFRELRLAAVDGEHIAGSTRQAHLVRARAACQRLRFKSCDLEKIRMSAEHAAQYRHR